MVLVTSVSFHTIKTVGNARTEHVELSRTEEDGLHVGARYVELRGT